MAIRRIELGGKRMEGLLWELILSWFVDPEFVIIALVVWNREGDLMAHDIVFMCIIASSSKTTHDADNR